MYTYTYTYALANEYAHAHIILHSPIAEYSLFYRALLQKRPIISRSLLIVVPPYHIALINIHRAPQYVMSHTAMYNLIHENTPKKKKGRMCTLLKEHRTCITRRGRKGMGFLGEGRQIFMKSTMKGGGQL